MRALSRSRIHALSNACWLGMNPHDGAMLNTMRCLTALVMTLFAIVAAAKEDHGVFTPSRSVQALDQPQGKSSVGTLEVHQAYPLLKTGGPGGKWCKVKLPGAQGWVPCQDGVVGQAEQSPDAPATPQGEPQDFSYYVLSLSWSPTFCASKETANPEQCGPGRHYGFVVHGLWPQHESGWPQFCLSDQRVDGATVEQALEWMPSRKLVVHEWRKHGTCSGLSAKDYFARVREARAAVSIPPRLHEPRQPITTTAAQIRTMFMEANPGLMPDMLAVVCKKAVSEVRVCMDKELRFRRCGSDVKDRCRGETMFPPVR